MHFPDKSFTGQVISVANIGEQLPNTDAKVFEVVVKLDNTDPILRPSMTTGNQIITKAFTDVVSFRLNLFMLQPIAYLMYIQRMAGGRLLFLANQMKIR
jgi:hypothetical protein